MILDNSTFEKVVSLFPNMPYNSAEYCGSWQKGQVDFRVGTEDKNGNLIAGVSITITEDFKIIRKARLTTTWGRFTRNQPTVTETIPLHPAGSIPRIYTTI